MTLPNKRAEIWNSLHDPEYREQFVTEEINVGLAFQIRSLRDRQKLTQEDLAKKLKRQQPLVSAWENPNYGKYTLATLKDLAKAFDVGLLVRFVPFGTLVGWAVDIKPDTIVPPSFSQEESLNALMVNLEKIVIDANQAYDSTSDADANLTQGIQANEPKGKGEPTRAQRIPTTSCQ